MTVRCPRCSTRYRLASRSRPDAGATYRCARCKHVFELDAIAAEPTLLDAEDDVRVDGEENDEEERFAFDDDVVEPDAEEEAETPRARRTPAPSRTSTVSATARFAVRSVAAIVLGYAILSIYIYTHPNAVHRALGQLPLIGSRLAEARLDPGSVQLTNVRGDYQRVQGDQLVFVIAGIAINNSPVPVNGIQIEGHINGDRDDRRVVFAGTAPHDVQELSAREIALLQTLEPPRDWSLRPGEQTNFMVVFVGPPGSLSRFSAEVVAVQARRRRPEPAGPQSP